MRTASPTTARSSFAALERIRRDFTYFLMFLVLPDAIRGEVRLEPWPHLIRLGMRLARGDSLIVLKARQVGVSWLVAAYCLWKAMYTPGAVVLMLSQGELEAKELLDKLRKLYERLPAWAQAPLLADNDTTLSWARGGTCRALPSTPKAGRSFTATVVVADEAGYHPFAAANYAAYKPTLDGGGQLIMVSTSAGPTGLFYTLYQRAKQGGTSFKALFIPWWARPSRQATDGGPDAAWLKRASADYAGQTAAFRHEYPNSEREAWTAIQGLVYGFDELTQKLIFSPDWHHELDEDGKPRGNLAYDPIAWEDCYWHYALVDWGGGDPTAVDIYGVTKAGQIHQYREYHWTGATPTSRIHAALYESEPKGGYDKVICGRDAPNSIAELKDMGFNAEAAQVGREEGFAVTAEMLISRRVTFNPETCPHTLAEFDQYFWATKTDQVSKESFATRTAGDHHADHKDLMRYLCMEVASREANDVDYSVGVEVSLT